MSTVKLPGAAAFAPPANPAPIIGPPPVPKQGQVTSRGESFVDTQPWPDGLEHSVYTFKNTWRAADVYLKINTDFRQTAVWTVRVYALLQGIRTLVATGRLGPEFAAAIGGKRAAWICAARAQATQFEVTLQLVTVGFPPITPSTYTIGVFGSDEADDPPEWVGAMRMSTVVSTALSTVRVPDPELILVQGAIDVGVAAARYIHIHDLPNGSPIAGVAPAFSIPLGNAAGQGGSFPLHFRAVSGFFTIVASSSDATTTQVFDCTLQGLVR